MEKILHITSGHSAAGVLRQCLRERALYDKVERSAGLLTYGPMPKDFSEKELMKRAQYLDAQFRCGATILYAEIGCLIKHDFDKYDKTVLWHGDNVEEQLLLYMLCSFIKKELYQADITALYELFPHFKNTGRPLSLGSCSSENARIMYDKIEPISPGLKQKYSQRWNYWSKSESPLRIMCDNTILEADEDYFDDFILSKCSCEYQSAARVIGEVLGYTDQLIGDQFLHMRIVELIRKGKITAFNHVDIADDIALCRNRVVVNGVDVTSIRLFSIKIVAKLK